MLRNTPFEGFRWSAEELSPSSAVSRYDKQAEGPSDSHQECGDAPLGGLGSRCGLDGLNSKRIIEIAINVEGKFAWHLAAGCVISQAKNS